LLTREYRIEIQTYDYRLPGGKVFDTLEEYEHALTTGEDLDTVAKKAAARELHEETGLRALNLSPLGISHCGATIAWDLHYFHCSRYSEDGDRRDRDVDEDITVMWLPIAEARKMCFSGDISEDRSALQLLRFIAAL
jgi:8-oxo-dGTP pyrophosphatase MutT (NUDIX family)